MINSCLLWALITVESAWNPNAVSPKGAKGLMQLMPIAVKETVIQCGLPESPDLFDPTTNIVYGTCLLNHYINVAKGDVTGALHLYNGGFVAYRGYMAGRRVNTETYNYVRNVTVREEACFALQGMRDFIYIDFGLQPSSIFGG